MPLQATSGAASYDAFGGGVAAVPAFVEDVFNTTLYTGNETIRTITTNIDLSGKGGLLWIKSRNNGGNHYLADTARGSTNKLNTQATSASAVAADAVTSFTTTGFTLGADTSTGDVNYTDWTEVAWTFRKQPKFFDVVTYTGDGTTGKVVNHSLGSEPACILVKLTSSAGSDWQVWHRNDGTTAKIGYLNLTSSMSNADYSSSPNLTFLRYAPTSTNFTLKASTQADASACNASGQTYIAYLFAHNAGGFGLTGTDNVISCGSFTTDGSSNFSATLGYEPQWVMIKRYNTTGNWLMFDNMRGMGVQGISQVLYADVTNAEAGPNDFMAVNSTGFNGTIGSASQSYIYIAIRRGPMKVPTDATKVFGMSARSGTGANATVTGGQTDDAVLIKNRGSAVASLFSSRLTGTGYLVTSSTAAEVAAGTTILQASPWDVMDGVKVGTTSTITNASLETFINYLFKRAPSFFDVVCGTADGSGVFSGNHNLTVVPEMVIRKARTGSADSWQVWHTGLTSFTGYNVYLNDSVAQSSSNAASFTSTTFSSGANCYASTNQILYLFATTSGVSKVGSYTGNGSTQTIDCGFTGGARFVLIKRIDASGNWYVYDTARGMTVLTDPYWRTDISFAENATLGSVTTVSTGFALDSTILAAINVSAGSYIFLAIA